jgi:hypothetical protein
MSLRGVARPITPRASRAAVMRGPSFSGRVEEDTVAVPDEFDRREQALPAHLADDRICAYRIGERA